MIQISVLVPTYRRPRLLRSCLDALAEQDLPFEEFEIVVVNDGSGAATESELARAAGRLPNLAAISFPENRGPAAARNRAVAESTGRLMLFLDDDVVAPPGLLRQHLRAHAQGDERLGVLGRVDWHPELRVTPFMQWLDHSGLQFAYDTWLREGPVEPAYAAFYTANLSMCREIFDASGGFDERFPYPAYEDMELAWRLSRHGFCLRYEPDIQAYHRRAITLADFRRRMAKVAESARVLAAVQPHFPIEEDTPLAGLCGPTQRLALAVGGRAARLIGRRGMLGRHYRAEIAKSYLEGRRRAEARLQTAPSSGGGAD
jgi:GT2 family glycosyltransferase